MQETHSNDWRSRLQGNAPTYVSLALAALIAVELARIAMSLLSSPVRSPQPTPTHAVPMHAHGMSDVQALVSAHLFGVAVADGHQDPSQAPLSSANLQLAGTIATDNPKHGLAIIGAGGPSKVYSVGDNVSGATLYAVYLDHVVLDRAGALETLLLPRQMTGGGARGPVRRGGAETAAAVDNLRHMVEKDPGILDQVMRTVASYDSAAGKLRGFRAYPGRNRALFSKLGLKPGDLVTAINGQPLDDPQHSQEVFNTIQSSDNVSVTIERGGQREDLSLNIAQVAGEATRDLEGAPTGPGAPLTPSGGAGGPVSPGTPAEPGTSAPAPGPGAPAAAGSSVGASPVTSPSENVNE